MSIYLRLKRRAPHLQSQSRLFSLPAELRIKIFTLALTAPPIPLAVIGPRNDFQLVLATPGSGGPDVYVIQAQRLLSLLQTCVRAHAEVLPLLYSINTFDVGDSRSIRLLARGVGAPFVRRLDFYWRLEKPPEKPRTRWTSWLRTDRLEDEWPKVWVDIKHLEALCWLEVRLAVTWPWTDYWMEREVELLYLLADILREGVWGGLTVTWERDAKSNIGAEELLPKWVVQRREFSLL